MKNSNINDLPSDEDDPLSEKSFVDFYSKNLGVFQNFLKSRGVKNAEDDIIQEMAIVVLKAIKENKIQGSLDKYIWGVLWIKMFNHFKKSGKHPKLKNDDITPDGTIEIRRSKKKIIIVSLDEDILRKIHQIADEYEDLEILPSRRKRLEHIKQAIKELPEEDETLVNGKILNNLQFKELSSSLGISLTNAKVKYHRIKERIKKKILLMEKKNETDHE